MWGWRLRLRHRGARGWDVQEWQEPAGEAPAWGPAYVPRALAALLAAVVEAAAVPAGALGGFAPR